MKHNLGVLILILFTISCNNKKAILPAVKMQAVMWDMIKVEAYIQQLIGSDSTIKSPAAIAKMQQEVCGLHGINKAQYLESYKYYNEHPDEMRIILDSISAKTEGERNKIMMNGYSGRKAPK